MKNGQIGVVERQIMWNRLISVVEEQAQALQYTAFSTIVRESGDLAAGVFDASGRMLAQAVTGTPGHINSMAMAVGHVIRHFPVETMKPGDVYIHNDPWMGTGHTNDVSLTTPCFQGQRLVGFLACNSHIMDIGGQRDPTTSTDVFMEGLYLPILKLVDAGKLNVSVIEIIRANTRQPVETVGDVYSMMNCNDVGRRRLLDMMAEFGVEDLTELANHIVDSSRAAFLERVAALPKGTWRSEMVVDGRDKPLTLKAALTISEEGIHVDYTGSAEMTKYNFNVPLCYTLAYTSYAIGCVIAGDIPNNAGSLERRTVTAPVGSIVNAPKPAAVLLRHLIGLLLPDLVFGCLRQAIPESVPAEGACVLWMFSVRGPWQSPPVYGDNYLSSVVTTGGTGAMRTRDGMSATGFPSGVRGGPIEIFEAMSTVVVWKKEYRQDSGGAGRHQGGLGQVMELRNSIDEPFEFGCMFERILNPARGADGGQSGAAGQLRLASSGQALSGTGLHTIPAGERLLVMSPGGGGIGDPKERAPSAVSEDLANGLISREMASSTYGYGHQEEVSSV